MATLSLLEGDDDDDDDVVKPKLQSSEEFDAAAPIWAAF